jgi:lysophospholipase L1-like esterase
MNNSGNKAYWRAALAVAIYFSMFFIAQADSIGPQAGQTVAFLGDSITQFGYNSNPAGYVHLVENALEQEGRKIVVIPAGVSGNTSKDMLARLDKDVLSKKPDWMTLSCGVNDVWHGGGGVALEDYKKNITSIVDQAPAAGIKVIILTSTMIMEDQSNPFNQKLIAYNDFLRSLATERHLLLADLNADMQTALAEQHTEVPKMKGTLLTVDGVHMNALGNQMMAAGVLKAMGVTDDQLAQARTSWMAMADVVEINGKTSLSEGDYLKLRARANSQGCTVDELVQDAFKKNLETLLQAPPSEQPANP